MKSKVKKSTNNNNNRANNQNKDDANKDSKVNTTANSKIKQTTQTGDVWNLEPILAGKKFDETIKEIQINVDKFKKYREILNENLSVNKLLEIILLQEKIATRAHRLEVYYELKFYENTQDQEALAKMGELKHITTQLNNDIMFFNLWFMKISDKGAKKFIDSKELQKYKYYLEIIRKDRQYTLNEDTEKILNIKDMTGRSAHSDIYEIITNKYSFEWFGKEISKAEIVKYYKSEDPKLREKSYDKILTKYKEDGITLSEIYKNIVTDFYNDGVKIRGHSSSFNIRNTGQDVSDKSVEALLKVIRKNAGVFTEYFKIKYELNKKGGQNYPYSRYHLYAPAVTKDGKKYTYEESKAIVLDTFKKFDPRFSDRALKIFNEKHVHSHPAPTKRSGALCYSITRDLLPYIMLNHTDSMNDVFTMIHELGHGVHDIFAAENQADMERHASLTVCETASVFGEMLLEKRMLTDSKDAEQKRYVLMQSLDGQWASIIRQAYFVIFELYAHEQIPKGISKDELDKKYYELLKEQFGDMQIPELFKHEWTYIPHIYNTPFYCYSYAWGNLFVLALYDMYTKEGKPFIDKYIELLSAGGSDSPANLMKKLGADPESEEFWQRGFNIIKEEIEELKKISK